jgi:hypothetical protein
MDKVGEDVVQLDMNIAMRFPVQKCRRIKNFACRW